MSNSSAFINIPPLNSGSSGISSLNGETGDVNLVGGTNITILPSGQTITISSTASGDVVGPVSSTANAIATYADTTGELLLNTDLIYASDVLNNTDVTSGTGTAGTLLTIRSANQTVASGTAAGAALTIKSGSATGAGSTGVSGTLILESGTSVGGNTGAAELLTANVTGTNVSAGQIVVKPGNSNKTTGGSSVSITAGENTGTGPGGFANITGGFATGGGNGGSVVIQGGGVSGGGTAGPVVFETKSGTDVAMEIGLAGGNDVQLGGAANTNLLWNSDGHGSVGLNTGNRPQGVYALTTMNLASLTPSSPVFSDGSNNLVSTGAVSVANGGTGGTSLVPYAVLAGGVNASASIQQVSGLGTSGFVLTSNGAGALPTWNSAGGGGANTALSNLSSVAVNQSLLYSATGGAFSLGYNPDVAVNATNAQNLIVQAQEKTNGSGSGGDTIIWGGITGQTSGDYGLVRLRTGGGAYPSFQKDWVFDFDFAGSTQFPGNLYLGASKSSFLNLSDGLHINFAGIEILGLTSLGFIETDRDLIFPNDVGEDRNQAAIGVIRHSGADLNTSWPPGEIQIQTGIVLGALQGGGAAVATPSVGQLKVVTGNPLELSADSVAIDGVATTTLTGSAGTAACSQPFTGASYKKVVVYMSGYSTTSQSYTFPVAFTHAPVVLGFAGGVSVTSTSTTAVTFTAAVTLTGFLILEGF